MKFLSTRSAPVASVQGSVATVEDANLPAPTRLWPGDGWHSARGRTQRRAHDQVVVEASDRDVQEGHLPHDDLYSNPVEDGDEDDGQVLLGELLQAGADAMAEIRSFDLEAGPTVSKTKEEPPPISLVRPWHPLKAACLHAPLFQS